jgi:hypothetical protein
MDHQLVFGSWKVRHNEPLAPGEAALRLLPLADGRAPAGNTWSLRMERASFLPEGQCIGANGHSEPWSGLLPDPADEVPLALVRQGPTGPRIEYLLMRLLEPLAQFFRVTDPGPVETPLWRRIAELYQRDHLLLSNHECYYVKDQQDIELEQKLDLGVPYPYFELCIRLYRALADGEAQGFRPQLGDEFQQWSYDNFFYEIQPNERRDAGYVSVISYCKRKANWNDPMFMFKKKIYDLDTLERWERNFENQWVDKDMGAALGDYFGYPVAKLPTWRRSRCDVSFESEAGNIFMVNFDDCRVVDGEAPRNRLQQCEIEYLKTRGVPDRTTIYADFERVVAFTEAKLAQWGLRPTRTHLSKLTFLKTYAAGAEARP